MVTLRVLFWVAILLFACQAPKTKNPPFSGSSDINDDTANDVKKVFDTNAEMDVGVIIFEDIMADRIIIAPMDATDADHIAFDKLPFDEQIVFIDAKFMDSYSDEISPLETFDAIIIVGQDNIQQKDIYFDGNSVDAVVITFDIQDQFDTQDQMEIAAETVVVVGEYCGEKMTGCEIACPPEKQCREKQCGCKNSDEFECDDGALCNNGQICVGLGSGIDGTGCCENDKPVTCGIKCCESGSSCEFEDGIDYCIPPGSIYCGKGAICDTETEKCWKNGCLPSYFNDCGEWFCESDDECGEKVWECYKNECWGELGTCSTVWGYGACIKSNHPETTGYISICSPYCKENNDCKMKGKNVCCQKVVIKYSETLSKEGTVCVPKGANNSCCDMFFECGEGCCLKDAIGCTKDEQQCLYPGEIDCENGMICPEGTFCSDLPGFFCPQKGSAKCEDGYYCPPGNVCINGEEKCCPFEQEICDNDSICCPAGFICHEKKGICVLKPECDEEAPIKCEYTCCAKDQICNMSGDACDDKCKPPTPIICLDKCCPNNFECACEEMGGVCKPKGAEMCDCEKEILCPASKECIKNEECIALGYTCKSLGAQDCPGALECYCSPGDVCTNSEPACCPAEAPVPCGDFCCPADGDSSTNDECVPLLKQCKASGEEYCGIKMLGCEVICPLGKKCMDKQCDCIDNTQFECNDGGLCLVTQVCVGAGKGIDGTGCCENDKSIACGIKCCDGGSTCAFENGVDYCVSTGDVYCGQGTICDATKQKCWKNQAGVFECIPSDAHDCGAWWCPSTEECAGAILKCCPDGQPKPCTGENGAACCTDKENCYAGICAPDKSAYCKGALPNKYCQPGYQCGYDKDGSCCCNKDTCMSSGGLCCSNYSNFGHYCNVGKQCCGSGCISSIAKCCVINSGTYCPDNHECTFSKKGCYPKGTTECDEPDPGYCQDPYPKCQHKVVGGQTKTYCCKYSSTSNCIEAYDLVPYNFSPPPGP
ncbi:hypothetical protein HZB94_02205 [Candidatus Falkowbacteria bacterium]|nr:hypothetical protein [Candidatus Falkowbacteria bacterium]